MMLCPSVAQVVALAMVWSCRRQAHTAGAAQARSREST